MQQNSASWYQSATSVLQSVQQSISLVMHRRKSSQCQFMAKAVFELQGNCLPNGTQQRVSVGWGHLSPLHNLMHFTCRLENMGKLSDMTPEKMLCLPPCQNEQIKWPREEKEEGKRRDMGRDGELQHHIVMTWIVNCWSGVLNLTQFWMKATWTNDKHHEGDEEDMMTLPHYVFTQDIL